MATNGHGIAHLSFQLGGRPFCKAPNACASVTPTDTMGYQICKRCAAKLVKMKEVTARREAKAS